MKRIVVGFLLVFVGSFCFAKGQRDSFELGLGYHSLTKTQTVSGTKIKTAVPSFAVSVAGETFYTEKIGIGAYGNLLIPQKFRVSTQGQSVTVDRSAYDFLLATDFLIGPAFMLYKNENETFCLPLAAGLHYYHLWSDTGTEKTSSNEIGLGANITAEYHFNQKIYIYGRFQLSLDLYSWGTTEVYSGYVSPSTSTSSGNLTTWSAEPSIGIGFQW
jgi:hypothetical protein